MNKFGLILVVSILGVGCGKEPGTGSRTQNTVPKKRPAKPAVASESQYLADVVIEGEKGLEGPKEVALEWDFSKKSTVAYDYDQTAKSVMDFGMPIPGRTDRVKQEATVDTKCRIEVRSLGTGKATFALRDLVLEMKVGGNGQSKPRKQQMPPIIIDDVSENGDGDFDSTEMTQLIRLLFPVDGSVLRSGEVLEIDRRMLFRSNGRRFWITGKSSLSLAGYRRVDNEVCPIVKQTVLIDKLDLPDDVEGDFEVLTKGVGYHLFSPSTSLFVTSKLAITMSMNATMSMPKGKVDGATPPEFPKSLRTATRSDNLIVVDLRDPEG